MTPHSVHITNDTIMPWYILGIDCSQEIDLLELAHAVKEHVYEATLEQELLEETFHVTLSIAILPQNLEGCLNTLRTYLDKLKSET